MFKPFNKTFAYQAHLSYSHHPCPLSLNLLFYLHTIFIQGFAWGVFICMEELKVAKVYFIVTE